MPLYRFLTDQAAPLIDLYLRRRLKQGREDAERFPERRGEPSLSRPAGSLLWCHAASVGEAMSVLAILAALRDRHPQWRFLLTTGTVTAARILEGRLPPGCLHQYMPVDRWPYVTRFLDHWRPDLVLWVESELWPNMLALLRARGATAILLNARMSEKSFRNWSLVKPWAQNILGAFTLALAQTEAARLRFERLGLADARCVGNLKFAAGPLPCDEQALNRLRIARGARKAWLIASTHPGEETIALDAHAELCRTHPDLLTIIVPRHAVRGDAVAALLHDRKLKFARRSVGDTIAPDTAIYLADTMSELGLFYRFAPVVAIGGSFVWGGHNPVEPAQLGCAMVFGPRMTNFADIAAELAAAGGAVQIQSPAMLASAIGRLLDDPGTATSLSIAARQVTERHHDVLDKVMNILSPFLAGERP